MQDNEPTNFAELGKRVYDDLLNSGLIHLIATDEKQQCVQSYRTIARLLELNAQILEVYWRK